MEEYDVVIAGAGTAGATAAALLAANKRSVVLLERDALPRSSPCPAWVNKAASPILEAIGLMPKVVFQQPLTDVRFLDASLEKSASPEVDGAAASLVQREELIDTLVQAATSAGARLCHDTQIHDFSPKEGGVEVHTSSGETILGRTLVVALGPGNPLIEPVLGHSVPAQQGRWSAMISTNVKGDSKSAASAYVVLGLNKEGAFGLILQKDKVARITVGASQSAVEAPRLLAALCTRLQAKGILQADLSALAIKSKAYCVPAAAALDMDSHVGKHALVIGEAGGFVSACSDEGIYPAMWSAQIAADVIHAALASKHSQDTLMEFDSKWRMAMAEYLRPPNTDMQFLIPLIFSNQPMANRMAKAFFCGENI